MTFDPDSITLSDEFHENLDKAQWSPWTRDNTAARWGAARAVEALKLQMPTDGIRGRSPTEQDADSDGQVQRLFSSGWLLSHWTQVAGDLGVWLHTPRWRPKPRSTPKQRALQILADCHTASLSVQEVQAIRAALALVPDAPEATP
jgi:hypothetical protein